MIRLTIDDESRAMSAGASKTALHVGVDGHVNESDIAQMPLTVTPERFKQLHR